MPASNYWITIDSFPYRLSEIYGMSSVGNSSGEKTFTMPSTYNYGGDENVFLVPDRYTAWGRTSSPSGRYKLNNKSIVFCGRGGATLPRPRASDAQLSFSSTYTYGQIPFECTYSANTYFGWYKENTDSDTYTSLKIYWDDTAQRLKKLFVNADNLAGDIVDVFPECPDATGAWVFIQGAGGGGGGNDSAGYYHTPPGGGGGGSGAWALVYLDCKKLYDDYKSNVTSTFSPYFWIRLGQCGNGGTVCTSDGSTAGPGKDGGYSYLYAYTKNVSRTLLITVGGGKGGSWSSHSGDGRSGGSGGTISISNFPTAFPYYVLEKYANGAAGGKGIFYSAYSAENPPTEQYGGAVGVTSATLTQNGQYYYPQRGCIGIKHVSDKVGGGGGASPCAKNASSTSSQAGWGAGGNGGWRTSGDNVAAQNGGFSVAGVLTPWTPTGYQAFTSNPTLTAESNSGNLDMKITNSNSFATTVRVSINGGRAYERDIAAGGSVYVRDVIGRPLPLYSSTYVRAIFTSGVNTSELATGYCTTSTDAGS